MTTHPARPWQDPAPGTTAHAVRAAVRALAWGVPALTLTVLADPAARAALLAPFGA